MAGAAVGYNLMVVLQLLALLVTMVWLHGKQVDAAVEGSAVPWGMFHRL